MDFCREHERALRIRDQRLQLQQAEMEQKISFRRRKRREFDNFCESLSTISILMAIAFVLGILFVQLFFP
ncbi:MULTISPECIES: hypothetical protein [Cyanophyceae]|uniref:hypothetical protein n=1 Tax=Cyanophyceae TaxID=3028117 RepID=UPI00016DCCF3|nr:MULTISPECIES: hypothetical protein [Cyanophyceae]ACB01039.1 hypothetical protein SYNPCC7002_F0108 [Picosynechococcus sp. PCC 7002]SMH58662.1 hypothetical protein SAMN06272755_3239 [Picosynechococcus sp. OG1]SMQ86373.1 hypothetical protein SAMN06272774_3113 [Synechococcus sp. 7002]